MHCQQPKLNLTFDSQIDQNRTYIFKVEPQFLEDLSKTQQLVIEGHPQDPLILNSNLNTYRIRGINVTTTMLVIDQQGSILQQTSTYLQVQKHDPDFLAIYHIICDLSCRSASKDGLTEYAQLRDRYSFTEYSVCNQCQINQGNFTKLAKAMRLAPLAEGESGGSGRYLYIGLGLAVEVIRAIIDMFNSEGASYFTPMTVSGLTSRLPLLNSDLLKWLSEYFQFQTMALDNEGQPTYKLTAKSIIRFIIGELALAKKQYNFLTFNEMVDQMIALYMPAESPFNPAWLKAHPAEKQQLLASKYDYFIELPQDRYISYNYMELETEIGARLRYLSGFKKRWRLPEMRALFRGIQCVENGKVIGLADVLLKKFRKYGQQYEIKFVLPPK